MGAVKGAVRRSESKRLPGAVTVLSIVASKDPSRVPPKVRASSRLALVAASISIRVSRERRVGRLNAGRAENWVRSM